MTDAVTRCCQTFPIREFMSFLQTAPTQRQARRSSPLLLLLAVVVAISSLPMSGRVPVAALLAVIAGFDPGGVASRRHCPPTRFPDVAATAPRVIPVDPDVLPTRRSWPPLNVSWGRRSLSHNQVSWLLPLLRVPLAAVVAPARQDIAPHQAQACHTARHQDDHRQNLHDDTSGSMTLLGWSTRVARVLRSYSSRVHAGLPIEMKLRAPKKADVVEHFAVFIHVGLLFIGPAAYRRPALHLVVRLP